MYILTDKGLGQTAQTSLVSPASSSSLFQQLQDALHRGAWSVAIGLSLLMGNRDENKLTDMVFFAQRHPDRQNQPLNASEKQQWLHIRDQIVRPKLQSVTTPKGLTSSNGSGATEQQRDLSDLVPLTLPSTPSTYSNALSIMKIICRYHNIPWRLGYTILNHEGGVGLFKHPDGVMQTIAGARKSNIRRIPRPLKLVLLGLSNTDPTPNEQLEKQIHQEFSRRLAIQIATGVQELKTALQTFNGYVALAFSAYNTGTGNAASLVTQGKAKKRPSDVTDSQWEILCRTAALLLHQNPNNVRIEQGYWLCDPNLCGKKPICKWIPRYGAKVYDKQSGRRLIGYQYLRSVKGCVPSQGPDSLACTHSLPKGQRTHPGSGPLTCQRTRPGTLDKLYNPQKFLGPAYYKIAQHELSAITDDHLPLKVVNGHLGNVHADGRFVSLSI